MNLIYLNKVVGVLEKLIPIAQWYAEDVDPLNNSGVGFTIEDAKVFREFVITLKMFIPKENSEVQRRIK
jgi:hypothetical protein